MPTNKFNPKAQRNDKSSQPKELPGALELFRPSWAAFAKNWPVFVFGTLGTIALWAIVLATVLVSIPSVQHQATTLEEHSAASSRTIPALTILGAILGVIALAAAIVTFTSLFYYVKLQSAKGIKVHYWAALRTSLHYFWRVLGLIILRLIIIIAGFILLVIPGLFLWRRYLLAPYYLVDQDLSIGQAMRASKADSKMFASYLWPMLALYVIFAILSGVAWMIVDAIGFVLGVIYTCAAAVRYVQIKAAK